ncbi:hypothetical protein TBS_10600 [Thermobispora bispora]|mgnify:CR=1 FL=1|uniref:Secreted protein n=1 Tax=Thermobispora bispora (strain ATCC 19993 / DSM 43833 / CBS 139.67 / JCM 10125 / KCTC 9307 / NBRC 14880 / R51) TaxID=469371 RepID=D6Y2B2_THEBD|nr:DUF948 domain-containing protein [Thermobispora bispora]MBO2473344.1 DUF948 domain-containing protein [Actinomycetales bacterium]MDI9580933.1 DUF948 domain-containing protein [Thermobispora sp.]ADG88761.1 hypothetical protein Tbis_2049 [Thermobispora bispora DSM 43833]MBX6166176.1 DUF948 domain-containing protein [Thermobispora bispora]QSI48530.1 DUF948 domain-containing protein [Thermobispora bispora]
MLTAGELAGLLIAVFWAILVCFMAVALVKLSRLLTETTKSVAELSERLTPLLDDVNKAVSETNRRLADMEAITDNVREVSGNMVKITGVASTLLAGPMIKISALGHGLRVAMARRERRAGALRMNGHRIVAGRTGRSLRSAERAPERRAIGRGRG